MRVCVCVYAESISVGVRACVRARACACVRECVQACVRVCVGLQSAGSFQKYSQGAAGVAVRGAAEPHAVAAQQESVPSMNGDKNNNKD